MTFFVDANVVLYAAGASEYRGPSVELLAAIGAGHADGRASTAVLEEIWHLELSMRIAQAGGLTERAYRLFRPLLPTTDEAFAVALSLDAPALGANDRLHVATCLVNGIGVIVSADAGFDGVEGIRRIDPLDADGLSGLIGTAAG